MSLNYGIKVSTPANEVLTQLDKDLAFTTKYSTIKILKAGDISVTTDGSGNGTESVTHGLSYAPAYLAYQKCTASWPFLDANTHANAYVQDPGIVNMWGSANNHALHVYTDSTKIYLQAKGATASTTFTIHYVLLLDLAEDYSGASSLFDKNIGFKVSKPGVDVLTAKPYELAFTSRCRSLQYHAVNYKTETLTLPPAWASIVDTTVEEGTYVDINHGLGYPPLFLAFFTTDHDASTPSTLLPIVSYNSIDGFAYMVSGFCDATKVRLSFYRMSVWWVTANPNYNYSETITLRCFIFTEDLSQSF